MAASRILSGSSAGLGQGWSMRSAVSDAVGLPLLGDVFGVAFGAPLRDAGFMEALAGVALAGVACEGEREAALGVLALDWDFCRVVLLGDTVLACMSDYTGMRYASEWHLQPVQALTLNSCSISMSLENSFSGMHGKRRYDKATP